MEVFLSGAVDTGMGLFQPGRLARRRRNKRKSGVCTQMVFKNGTYRESHVSFSQVFASLWFALAEQTVVIEHISPIMVQSPLLHILHQQSGA